MTRFMYSLLQFRGDPVRREAVNLGVVVVGPGGEVALTIDPLSRRRISAAWPEFDRRLFRAFVRDLGHILADEHQLMLGETVHLTATPSALTALSNFTANQFAVTEPLPYNATSASEAVSRLYQRLVQSGQAVERKDRHLTRARLRHVIGDLLETWAQTRLEEIDIAKCDTIRGAVTSHTADLVTYVESEPKMVFFATPLDGETSALIRDSLPTIVRDLQRRHPAAEYFAVLGDEGIDWNDAENPAYIAKRLLSDVQGLSVIGLAELREEFSPQLDVSHELQRAAV